MGRRQAPEPFDILIFSATTMAKSSLPGREYIGMEQPEHLHIFDPAALPFVLCRHDSEGSFPALRAAFRPALLPGSPAYP